MGAVTVRPGQMRYDEGQMARGEGMGLVDLGGGV